MAHPPGLHKLSPPRAKTCGPCSPSSGGWLQRHSDPAHSMRALDKESQTPLRCPQRAPPAFHAIDLASTRLPATLQEALVQRSRSSHQHQGSRPTSKQAVATETMVTAQQAFPKVIRPTLASGGVDPQGAQRKHQRGHTTGGPSAEQSFYPWVLKTSLNMVGARAMSHTTSHDTNFRAWVRWVRPLNAGLPVGPKQNSQ